MNEFKSWCEALRKLSIQETNVPIILVIQNGVASAAKISKLEQRLPNIRNILGLEVEMLINKTKIKGGSE